MTFDARNIRLIMDLRRSGVDDTTLLGAIERTPRHLFVPDAFQDQAYEDIPLPIGHGQTISQPLVVVLMTKALEVTRAHRVLEIGTGSGYQAAVLARLCRRVYTVERLRPLMIDAHRRFERLGLHNVTTRLGDGTKGWPEQAPFERIIVTAGAAGEEPPPDLPAQLAVGGVMIIPLGEDRRAQRVVRIRRDETGFQREELWPVRFVPLLPEGPPSPGADAPSA